VGGQGLRRVRFCDRGDDRESAPGLTDELPRDSGSS